VDYSETIELCRQSGIETIGIPGTFSGRDQIASNIAISSAGGRGGLNVVKSAKKTNELGEQKVLDLVKGALSLCGQRLRHSRIAILGLSGLESHRNVKLSLPPLIRILESRGAILSVYPGKDERWFETRVLGKVRVEDSPLRAASKANCAVLALDRTDFGEVSPQKLASEMSRPAAVCDLSRVLEASNVERVGLFYTSIGRGFPGT